MDHAAEFLNALFSHLPPGSIETRVIGDRRGGEVYARTWHAGADELLAELPRLRSIAENRHAGVFYGVLPRGERGNGTAAAVAPGVAIWADLDFKHFPGGEEEARRIIAGLPLPPTAIVASGHGLHVYFILREPEAPDVLSALSARLGHALGGDRVHDPARILRLPGTINFKDPADPVEARLEVWEPSRRYNPSDFDFLPVAEEAHVATGDDTADDDIEIAPEISTRVRELIKNHKGIGALFHGRGKLAKDGTGKPLDTTSSGYDFSFVHALVKKGVTDASELATALYHRPDDAARIKGTPYILRTVRAALKRAEEAPGKKKTPAIDFTVEKVRIFASDPPGYEFMIAGRGLRLEAGDLVSSTRFRHRFLAIFHRIPTLPSGDEWAAQVNAWLAGAVIDDLPPEASPDGLLGDDIEKHIADLGIGENRSDLNQGRAVMESGHRAFKLTTLLKRLREDHGVVGSHTVARHLRKLGYRSQTIRVADGEVRAWVYRAGTS